MSAKVFQPSGDEEIVFSGERIEVVHQPHSKGDKIVTFEWGQRPPGVRIVAVNPEGKILLTREYRHELDDYDYRLPGGKVADTLAEWHQQRADDNEDAAAEEKVVQEGREEGGIDITALQHIETVPDGATFKWDLKYYEATEFTVVEQELEDGEDISVGWYAPEEVLGFVFDKKNPRRAFSIYFDAIFKGHKALAAYS